MKYRKKPVVVEAVQWNGNNHKEVIDFAENKIWFDALGNIWIATLEGDMVAKKGDYIIKGVQGEYYPCKPDIFAETYEKRRSKMLKKAKQLASQEFSRLAGREIKEEDCFVVWFSKTLQNWKALVSTNKITSSETCGDYAEITHNGDKKETYVDVYAKVSNRAIKD